MEYQRMQLSNIKNRLLHGEQIVSTRVENGEFIVHLTNGPEIAFDAGYQPTVEDTIQKVQNGIRENTVGNNTTLKSISDHHHYRGRP